MERPSVLGDLEIYRLAHDLAVEIHAMSRTLPSFETYEEGSQIRRSSKRVAAGIIVEGMALRRHRNDFLLYLYRSLASSDETQEHLRFLCETGSLSDPALGTRLLEKCRSLSGKLVRFIQGVETFHGMPQSVRRRPPSCPPSAS